jgi:hypothetical protein
LGLEADCGPSPQRNEGGCRIRYNTLKASSQGEKAAVSRGDDELVPVKTAGKATPRIKIRPPWTEQEDAILIEKYGHRLGLVADSGTSSKPQ